MKQSNPIISEQDAQMLLAAGMVLLMSLLSMSLYGVKVAGYDLPRTSDAADVLDAAEEVNLMLPICYQSILILMFYLNHLIL